MLRPRQTGGRRDQQFLPRSQPGATDYNTWGRMPIRAWCSVSDLIDAVEAVLDTPEAAGGVFNIGNPREVETTLGLARRFQRLAPEVKIEFVDVPRPEVKARIPVIQKARDIIEFEAKSGSGRGFYGESWTMAGRQGCESFW